MRRCGVVVVVLDGSHSGGCGGVVTDVVLDGGDGGGGGGVGAGVHLKTNPKDKNQTKIIFHNFELFGFVYQTLLSNFVGNDKSLHGKIKLRCYTITQ